MLLADKSRAEERKQRGYARLQNFVLESRWQPAFSFGICRVLSQYRRGSYPAGTVSEIESSSWPFLGSLLFRNSRDNVRTALTLGEPCFHAPLVERDFSNPILFSLLGSMTVLAFSELFQRPLMPLRLRGRVVDGSPKSSRAFLVDTRVF